MKWGYRLAVVLIGGVVLTSLSFAKTIVEPQFAVALAQENVNTIAEQITVMIDGPGDDEQGKGSGVIVGREGNIYYVLTNRHVVEKNGDYQVQTVDGTRYVVNSRQIQKLPGLDLAVVQFSSNQNYTVAKLGDSEKVSRRQKIYVVGYATPGVVVTTRTFIPAEGIILNRVAASKDGYALVYSLDIIQPGMSGGPVLDERGQLIGINGLAQRDETTGRADLIFGIPSNTFRNWQAAIVPVPTQPAAVTSTSDLDPKEISKISKEFTVIIGGEDGAGSGVIVKRQGDIYTVITANHVVARPGAYNIQTPDGQRYEVIRSQQIADLDLAVIRFSSKKNYRVAQTGNSDQIVEGATIYVAGYIYDNGERNFRFFSTLVTGKKQDKDGYNLAYGSNTIYPGTSGAPVLNTQGRLIGIQGKADTVILREILQIVGTLAIPTNLFVSLLDKIPFPSIIGQPLPTRTSTPITFYCGISNGQPATLVRTVRGPLPLIIWENPDLISGLSPEQRCEEVSARFQRFYDNKSLEYVTTGTIVNQPVLCVPSERNTPCSLSNVLIPLSPGTDAKSVLEKILNGAASPLIL
jgi:S1-C subfamily serine protease